MRITHPTPDFTGPVYVAPTILDFKDGTATPRVPLPATALAKLEAAGYGTGGMAGHTIPELRELAEAQGVEVPEKAKKAEIVALLGEDGA